MSVLTIHQENSFQGGVHIVPKTKVAEIARENVSERRCSVGGRESHVLMRPQHRNVAGPIHIPMNECFFRIRNTMFDSRAS